MEQSRVSKILIFTGFTIVLLGLFANIYLVQQKQTVTSKASEAQLNIEIITPKTGAKVLGITRFKAKVKTNEDITILQAVLRINEQEAQDLKVERLEDNVILSGELNSSKFAPGVQGLEVLLYKKESTNLKLLGKTNIQISIVTP